MKAKGQQQFFAIRTLIFLALFCQIRKKVTNYYAKDLGDILLDVLSFLS